METIRILLADDHAAVRRSIRSLLEAQPQWEVCCEAKSGREAVEQARTMNPDIVLLDITMPELNGFEAARQILDEMPRTRVLLLSLHQSEELSGEARRAGAEGVILKSDAHMLTAAIHSRGGRATAVHLAGSEMGRARHVAAFFNSDAERHRVVDPFILEGLTRGEKVVHIIDRIDHEEHIRRLMNAGIDVDRVTRQGQMEIVHWDAMYLQGGRFDQQAMLTRLEQVFRNTVAQGFPLARTIGNMEWALAPPPSVRDLVEYESRVNDLSPELDDVVVCAYNLEKFDAAVILDVMRAHPAVILGGTLRENPFYVPPGQMLEELRQRKEDGSRPG
jgi:DNA-binding NarL/FixJ family response regulator